MVGVRAALRAVEGVCGGGEAAGQAAGDDAGRRFRWLIAPRSTVVQPGAVHSGPDHGSRPPRSSGCSTCWCADLGAAPVRTTYGAPAPSGVTCARAAPWAVDTGCQGF